MDKFLGILTALIVGCVLLALAVGYANTQATERNYSEAAIIRAQAESRLTAATAGAITSAALLPWFALTILGVLGLAVMALAAAIITRPPRPPVERIETRTLVYLPAPGQTRAQLWQGVSKVKLLESPQVMVIEQPNFKRLEGVSDEKRS